MNKTSGMKAGVVALVMMGLIGAALMLSTTPRAEAGGQNAYVSKTADVYLLPLEGGEVTFTFYVQLFGAPFNQVDALVDDVLGDLNGLGTCSLPASFEDSVYSCTVTATVTPPNGDTTAPHTNFVSATLSGEFSTTIDSFPVEIDFAGISATKIAFPTTLPTAGGDVEYTFVVRNEGSVDMSVDSLIDDKFGDLDGKGDCELPQELAVGEGYLCTVTETLPAGVPGVPHVNTVTAVASVLFFDEVQPAGVNSANLQVQELFDATATANATVEYLATGITATKSANPGSVPEAGGDVTFTYGVTNVGDLEMIVDSLADDKLGDLAGQGDCAVGETIAAGASYTCTVTVNLSGTAATPHVNTFTANATSVDTETLEENTAAATAAHQAIASATVTFVAPSTGIVRLQPLLPSPEEPAAVAEPSAVPAAAAAAIEPAAELAFTASESSLPAALALGSISAGALLLGWLRKREDRR